MTTQFWCKLFHRRSWSKWYSHFFPDVNVCRKCGRLWKTKGHGK